MLRKYKLKTAVVVLLALFVYGVIYGTVKLYYRLFQDGGRKEGNNLMVRGTDSSTPSKSRLHGNIITGDRRLGITVPKLAKYCNTPYSQDLRNEGSVLQHYTLLSAYVMVTPGYSAPTSRVPRTSNLSCFMDINQVYHLPKVDNFVRVMNAASQRTPRDLRFDRWALYPNHVTCSDGQLTGVGAIQSIAAGIHYSERYFHTHKLFDETNWQVKVSAETVQSSRTFQSAVAFLYGLLPSFHYEKINLIASKRLDFCENGLYGSRCACLNIESLPNKVIRECCLHQTYLDLLKKYNHVLELVKTVLNVHEHKRIDPVDLLQVLNGYTCQNATLPCNSQGLCVFATTLEPLQELVAFQQQCMTKNENYKLFAKVTMHGLLNRITQEMNLMINGKSNRAFQLYLGNTDMFLQLATALQPKDTVWLGYASSIAIELFRNYKTNEHFIQVLQNGQVVTTQLGFCANVTGDGFCNFYNFQDQISHYFQYHQYCNREKYFP